MTKKVEFIGFVKIYCSYLLKEDNRLNKEQSKKLEKYGIDFFNTSAPYTCCSCGNKSGLSFIENKHFCKNPMFDKKGIPILSRVVEECNRYGLNFEKIQGSIKIKEDLK